MSDSPRKQHKQSWGNGSKSKNKLTPLEDAPSPPPLGSSTSTKSIARKKELIEAVRRLNPAGVNAAPQIFWDVEGSLKTGTIDSSDVQQQLNIVESGVNYSARRFNDLRVENDRLTKSLKAKLDELDEQKKNFEQLDSMKKATTMEGLRITALGDEIIEVEEDCSRKQHYTRQLEHVLQRLKQNQLKFDAHMTGMEDAMKAVVKEGAEVRLLRRGLDAGLAKAEQVYEETQANLNTARKDRDGLMLIRRGEIKNAYALQEWLKQREDAKAVLAVELRGDLTRDEEKFLRTQINEQQEKSKKLQRSNEERKLQLQAMEEAFAQTKQVTGVSSLEEMHEKFSSQKNNKKSLEQEVKDAEAKLLATKKLAAKKEKAFQELKSSGGGTADLTREMMNKLEDSINVARTEQKVINAGTTRLESVLLGLQQGGIGLQQRVHPYLHLAEGGIFELTQSDECADSVSVTLDALSTAEQVLAKMLEILSGNGDGGNSPNLKMINFDDDDDQSFQSDMRSMSTREEAPSFANNVRIKSRFMREAMKDDEIDQKETKATNQLTALTLDTMSQDEPPAATLLPPTQLLNEDSQIPTRLTVKKSSSRTSLDAERTIEMDIRRKRLTAIQQLGASEGGNDDGINRTARLKSQKETGDRLCTIKHPPTLPEGVGIRDDVMAKTNAFLTKMPKLV
jgi:hypothetical protein